MSLKQPVQYPVKYYSHLDAGAPQLADIDGNIKTILKAGLVTGIGTKEGAGWASLFEDDFRIVLRRPLRTGNPPDIKIENGVINGTASHRIISQDNPTGLDDTAELASVNLVARDSNKGVEWHLIVSDFGFVLCYQMAEYGNAGEKNNMLYLGSMQKLHDSDPDIFLASKNTKASQNGRASPWMQGLLGTRTKDSPFINMRTKIEINDKTYILLSNQLTEKSINNDYLAQKPILFSRVVLPFYCSVIAAYSGLTTQVVSINGRNMLRYVNKLAQDYGAMPFYIPLDYWEL